MESSLVIKVKYGDTLRRFTALVNENSRLDLDMAGLRAKILSLFNFNADANLVLTYIDEDGDSVTLVDDADLQDVMRQDLKFLKIYVHFSNDSGAKSDGSSSGSATPISAQVLFAPDAFKGVPEPIRQSVAKLTTDVLSSSPVLSAIVDSTLKMAIPFPNPHGQANAAPGPSSGYGVSSPHSQAHAASGPSSGNGVPKESSSSGGKSSRSSNASQQATAENAARTVPVVISPDAWKSLGEAVSKLSINSLSSSPMAANIADYLSKMGIPSPYFQAHVAAGVSSNNGVPKESTFSEARGPQPTREDKTSNADQKVAAGNVTRGVAAGVTPVDLNTLPTDPYSSQSTKVNAAPVSPAASDGDGKKGKKCTDGGVVCKGEGSGTSPNHAIPKTIPFQMAATGSGAFNAHPFPGAVPPVDFGRGFPVNLGPPMGKQGLLHRGRTMFYHEASGMFHKGVRCDGCGIYPITGPRFKSKVKENYDLCSICLNEMGNESDYTRIDRPLSGRALRQLSGAYEYPPGSRIYYPPVPPPTVPHVFAADATSKHAKPKLDSRFILDVNVIDGTMMAPSTAFTKIWRMRNNGTQVWPKGTQLVWIGGDQFSASHSVYLEVPEDGVPVDKELDIAVNFRAPQLPGRYVSYWKMASPSGQKFGQRVWVLIQVDASLKDSFYDSSQGLNLNIPLAVNGSKGPHIIDINAQPQEAEVFLQHLNLDASTESVNQVVDKHPKQDLENKLSVDEAKFVGPADSTPAPAMSAPSSSVSFPIIGLSATAPAFPPDQHSSTADYQPSSLGIGGGNNHVEETLLKAFPTDQQSSSADTRPSSLGIGGGNNPVEETLLKELEEMGFKQVGLNKEILRMNEYNLEQSVDDLCGVSEWDPILEELQDMGFHDSEMNMKLLKKNKGSIKRVVMDLIHGVD